MWHILHKNILMHDEICLAHVRSYLQLESNARPMYCNDSFAVWNVDSGALLSTQICACTLAALLHKAQVTDGKLECIQRMSTSMCSGWVLIWTISENLPFNPESAHESVSLTAMPGFPFFMSERHWHNLQSQSCTYPVRQVVLIKYRTSQLSI